MMKNMLINHTAVFITGMIIFGPVVTMAFFSDYDTWIRSVLASGPIGIVLLWFMFRMEKYVKHNTEVMERLARASMVFIINSRRATEGEKEAAQTIINDLDKARRDLEK